MKTQHTTRKKLIAATVAAMVGLGASFAFAAGNDNSSSVTHDINPVSNPYSPAFGAPWRHGVIPTREVQELMRGWANAHGAAALAAPTASQGILSFGGGVNGVGVLSGQSKVYLVFYGSQWGTQTTDANGNLKFSNDAAGAAGAAQQMFKGIGTNGELWSAELTQWCDGAGVASGATTCPSGASFIPYQQNIFAGAWYDNSVASPSQATGTQLAQEAIKAAQHFGNTAAGSNRYTYYVILSPTGTNPDNYKSPTQGYCAWHDYTGDGYGVTPTDIAFSNQPYNIDVGSSCGTNFVNSGSAGTLDGYTMTLGHEWHEMMSDQFPAGGWTNHTGGTYNGQENSDECAWIAPGSAGGAANITFSTGTFAEQASWSNDTGNCAISHAILTHTGNVAPTANFSFVTSGLTATFSDSSTDSDGTIASHSWTFGDGGTSTATSPSHTYAAAGTYSVKETVTDNGGLSSSVTKSVTVTTTSNALSNGVGVVISSSTVNQQLNYTVAIPSGSSNLNITLSGGTGDADLYVKFGSAPTLTSYDCRPYVSGNTESCPFATPQVGTYYVMVNTYAAYSNVTLKATWTVGGTNTAPTANFTFTTSGLTATFTDTSTDPQGNGTITGHSWNFGDGATSTATSPSHTYAAAGTYSVSETVTDSGGLSNTKTTSVTVSSTSCGGLVLCSGVAVALPAVSTGGVSSTYTMVVPSGKTSVVFTISGGTGDADLYVKIGSAPTTTSYNCRPYTTGNNETCTFNSPVAGTYYVNVRAYASYSGVSLKGTISP